MRALLVHNPKAGSGRPSGDELLAALDAAGFSTTYCSIKNDDLDAALAEPADIVIVAGGDGSVAEVARSLKDRKTLLAILPFGTANNIARCLGIAGEPHALIKALRGAPVARLDIGLAVGPWGSRRFVEAVGCGALAKAVDRDIAGASKETRIERGRASFAEIIAEHPAKQVAFTADGEAFEDDVIFLEALNLGMTGPRMIIGPTAQPGDQLLDIVYLPAERRQEMLDWLAENPDGDPAPLTIRKARKATVSWIDGRFRVDDEVFDAPDLASNIIVELEPDSLRVCVPPRDD
jgi:diacylglycerol kinase family enzyme